MPAERMIARANTAAAVGALDLTADWGVRGGNTALANGRTGATVTFEALEARVTERVHRREAALVEYELSHPVVVVEVGDEADALVELLAAARLDIGVFFARQGTLDQPGASLQTLTALGFDGVLSDGVLRHRVTTPARDDTPRVLLQSGGTTGIPRPVPVDLSPGALDGMRRLFIRTGWRTGMRQLLLLPLHHAAGLIPAVLGLLDGHTLTFPGRTFDPADTLALVARERLQWSCVTPTHLRRLGASPAFEGTALDTLDGIVHTAAPCDHATKRHWIERLGAERVHEFASSTEQIGLTYCSGTSWLERPGTVGRGFLTRVSIRRPDGTDAAPGEPGEVFLRSLARARRTRYSGVRSAPDGALSVGDCGFLDEDGYLFLVGRDGDMFTVGGENIYPAEVERVLLGIDGVDDVLVRPRPHKTLGALPEALIVRRDSALTGAAIRAYCRTRLPAPARPQTIAFVEALPRTDTGKLPRKEWA